MSFLPGTFPGLSGGGGVPITDAAAFAAGSSTLQATYGLETLLFIASVSDDAASLTAMSDIRAGDLLVWYDWTLGGGLVVPSGFTQIGNTLAGSAVAVTAYKIADGSESGATISGMSGGLAQHKFLLQFRAEGSISNVAVQDVAQQITNGNPSSQTCNASGGTVPLVVIGTYSSSGDVSSRTFSPSADAEISQFSGFGISSYVKYKVYNSSPSDTTIDSGDDGDDNTLQSFYLEIS